MALPSNKRSTPTLNQRSTKDPRENPPTVAAALATLVGALGLWFTDTVTWPGYVEIAVAGLFLAAGAACGKVAQRWTKRVYYGAPPEEHAPPPGPALNRSGTRAAWD